MLTAIKTIETLAPLLSHSKDTLLLFGIGYALFGLADVIRAFKSIQTPDNK